MENRRQHFQKIPAHDELDSTKLIQLLETYGKKQSAANHENVYHELMNGSSLLIPSCQ